MNWLESYLTKHLAIDEFITKKGVATHMNVTQEALLLYGVSRKNKTPLFVVKENDVQVQELAKQLREINPNLKVVTYLHEESLRIEAIASSDVMRLERVNALYCILKNDFDICLTHSNAAIRKISPKSVLREGILSVTLNQEISMNDFAKKLVQLGYTRVKYVERPFTFAMRGGICDVFSPQSDNPIRIEFFDVEIESLRYFDISSQKSIETIESAEIVFASDVLLEEKDLVQITASLEQDLRRSNEALQDEVMMKLDFLNNLYYEDAMYPYLAYWDRYETILDYIDDNLLIYSPIESIERSLIQNQEDVAEYIYERYENNLLLPNVNVYPDYHCLDRYSAINIYEYQHDQEIYFPWHPANIVSNQLEDVLKVIAKESLNSRIIIVLSDDEMESFLEKLIKASLTYEIFQEQTKPGIYIQMGELSTGFVLEDIKTNVYTGKELNKNHHKFYRYDDKFLKAESLNQIQDLETFDYVVHRQYGIGKYMGITTKEIEGILKDFMRIQYRDGDELFVPLEQFNLVRKYISSEAVSVRLSKLGSSAWRKSQERIKENVNDVAERLIELYTERSKAKGHAFSPDTDYQKQFELEFPYELTNDQKQAISEIKADMESIQPMDRLLCGDVGFGKTEVAIRAAFKSIVDEKQVIFLCPTTILSSQHHKTFTERFKNYPIRIEVLNRFVSPAQQKLIIKDFTDGNVDILIGTHRVLSKDVKPHDLGLLIIDEEQRFGVDHKERIKELKINVDVLSLSATPIPRTLQMSLIGIRSLSQLNTPPSNRLPVMTYVIEKNEKTIHDVIQKELNRNGQVFYLFNNVEQIYNVATKIQMSVDKAEVGVVHGQMDRYEIEDVMYRFVNKEINTLVCTTIIETGIDIPNANTILVDNAHHFGLSQLYQIKGRVGRSSRLAYAYFLVPSTKNLSEVAQKRLQAIKEFTQLGSGYKIAMRDLTIRGAGELLGDNQSGFIDTVGIDLYIELLQEAIALRQGKDSEVKEVKAPLNLNVEGYFPEKFTTDDGEKLELYQEINKIETIKQLKSFNLSLQDRYGKLPQTVEMLLEKKRLEIFLNDPRIESFKEYKDRIELVFTKEYSDRIDGTDLFMIVSDCSYDIKIKYLNQKITLTFLVNKEWIEHLIYILENIKERNHEA